jgi:hypothetical protein
MKKGLPTCFIILAACLLHANKISHEPVSEGKIVTAMADRAGEDDPTKTLIKHSSVCVHKAQKMMLANHKTDVGGKLAQAVRLQTHAVHLYNSGKQSEAACSSIEARKLASEIIKEVTGKEDAYASVSNEELSIAGHSETRESILKNSYKTLRDISDKDNDYLNPTSLNNNNIDFK